MTDVWHIGEAGIRAVKIAGVAGNLIQEDILSVGEAYQVELTHIIDAGDYNPTLGTTTLSAGGAVTSYKDLGVCAGNDDFLIAADSSFNSVLDNIKCYWINPLTDVYDASGGGVLFTVGASAELSGNALLDLPNIIEAGKTYRITFDIVRTAGNLAVIVDGNTVQAVASTASYDVIFDSGAGTDILFDGDASCDMVLTNISVQEVITLEEALTNGTFSASACSEPFSVKQSHGCTKLLRWRNDENAFDFNYDDFSTYYHSIRLKAKLWQMIFRKDVKKVFRDGGGRRDIRRSITTEAIKFTIAEVPLYVHQALAIAIEHDYFEIDGVEYISEEEDYAPIWRKSSILAPSIFELIENGVLLENKSCQ
jgi:hypothetical protein